MNTFKTIAIAALVLSFGAAPLAQAQTPSPTAEDRAEMIRLQIENRRAASPEARPLEKRIEIRKDARADIKEVRMEAHTEMRTMKMANPNGTTTVQFKKEAKMEMKKKMETKQFEIRKAALIKELDNSLANLGDIAIRIETRITKAESEGRDMTTAKAELVIAKQKVEKARTEVAVFKAASTTQATGSTTVEVDLAKPRQLGDAAIKSTKEARDALQKVVKTIAHNMGMNEKKMVPSPSASVSASANTAI